MEYPGVLKKEHVEIPGLFVYDLGITKGGGGGGVTKVTFLTEFLRSVLQFCFISRGESLFSSKILKVKSQI